MNTWLMQWLRVIAQLAFWSVTMDDINTMDVHFQNEYLEVKVKYSYSSINDILKYASLVLVLAHLIFTSLVMDTSHDNKKFIPT